MSAKLDDEHPLAWVLEQSTFGDLVREGVRQGMQVCIEYGCTSGREVRVLIQVDGEYLADFKTKHADRYVDIEYQAIQQAWEQVEDTMRDDGAEHPSLTAAERN